MPEILYPCKVLCFLQANDNSIHAVVHCCNASNHKEDGKLLERWYKEYGIDEVMKVVVPQLRCVSVDAFEDSCFVVEDKPGLFEELGSDLRKINNGNYCGETQKKAGQTILLMAKKNSKPK